MTTWKPYACSGCGQRRETFAELRKHWDACTEHRRHVVRREREQSEAVGRPKAHGRGGWR